VTAARLITVGHVTHDRYGDDIVAGGCAFYAARTQAALGADVHLITAVGADFACDDALAGLTVDVTRGGLTTLFTNLYPAGALRVQRIEATAPPVAPPARLPDAALVHLAPVLQEVDLAAWVAAAGDRPVAIAVQGWIKDRGPGETVVQTRGRSTARCWRGSRSRRAARSTWSISAICSIGCAATCRSSRSPTASAAAT
jgi:hypothetical protein